MYPPTSVLFSDPSGNAMLRKRGRGISSPLLEYQFLVFEASYRHSLRTAQSGQWFLAVQAESLRLVIFEIFLFT